MAWAAAEATETTVDHSDIRGSSTARTRWSSSRTIGFLASHVGFSVGIPSRLHRFDDDLERTCEVFGEVQHDRLTAPRDGGKRDPMGGYPS